MDLIGTIQIKSSTFGNLFSNILMLKTYNMEVIKYLKTYFLRKIIKFDYNFMAGITYMLAWDSIVVDGMSSKSFYISK